MQARRAHASFAARPHAWARRDRTASYVESATFTRLCPPYGTPACSPGNRTRLTGRTTKAELRPWGRSETQERDMRNFIENQASDLRPLTTAELTQVSGGSIVSVSGGAFR